MTRELNPNNITHIEHLDDMVMYNPDLCIKHLMNIKDKKEYGSLKWDGSPSIVIGKKDGTEFVSTKSFFNKTPVLYKNYDEILSANLSTELTVILFIGLNFGKTIQDNTIHQGDIMYCPQQKNIKSDTITFGLNLIQYSINSNHPDYELIKDSKIGIAFHTSYDYSTDTAIKCTINIQPKNTNDVYVFVDHKIPVLDKYEEVDDLIENVKRIKKLKENLELNNIHDLIRKYKTHCLGTNIIPNYNDFASYSTKLIIDKLSSELSTSTYKVRAHTIKKLESTHKLINDTKKYVESIFRFSCVAQSFIKLVLQDLEDFSITAEHEGLVISTDEYIIKYVDKSKFTKLNNEKRNKK